MKQLFILCLAIICGLADASVPSTSNQDKAMRVYVDGYSQGWSDNWNGNFATAYDTSGNIIVAWTSDMHENYSWCWQDGYGGSGDDTTSWSQYFSLVPLLDGSGTSHYSFSWPATGWPDLAGGTLQGTYAANWIYAPADSGSYTNTYGAPAVLQEYCDVKWRTNMAASGSSSSGSYARGGDIKFIRGANTQMTLQTGGKALSRKKHLFTISATASNLLFVANPSSWDIAPLSRVGSPDITVMGKSLDAYGNVYVVLEDNDTVDVTPVITGNKFYNFTVGAGKQCAKVILTFSDEPRRPYGYSAPGNPGTWPWHWQAKLDVVCTGSDDTSTPDYTNHSLPLASITYGFVMDSSGTPAALDQISGDKGNNGDMGKIVVIDYEPVNSNSQTNGGIRIMAYYIGCCNNSLNWVQTLITNSVPILGESSTPHTDPPDGSIPPYPYYFLPGWGKYGINTYTSDYPYP